MLTVAEPRGPITLGSMVAFKMETEVDPDDTALTIQAVRDIETPEVRVSPVVVKKQSIFFPIPPLPQHVFKDNYRFVFRLRRDERVLAQSDPIRVLIPIYVTFKHVDSERVCEITNQEFESLTVHDTATEQTYDLNSRPFYVPCRDEEHMKIKCINYDCGACVRNPECFVTRTSDQSTELEDSSSRESFVSAHTVFSPDLHEYDPSHCVANFQRIASAAMDRVVNRRSSFEYVRQLPESNTNTRTTTPPPLQTQIANTRTTTPQPSSRSANEYRRTPSPTTRRSGRYSAESRVYRRSFSEQTINRLSPSPNLYSEGPISELRQEVHELRHTIVSLQKENRELIQTVRECKDLLVSMKSVAAQGAVRNRKRTRQEVTTAATSLSYRVAPSSRDRALGSSPEDEYYMVIYRRRNSDHYKAGICLCSHHGEAPFEILVVNHISRTKDGKDVHFLAKSNVRTTIEPDHVYFHVHAYKNLSPTMLYLLAMNRLAKSVTPTFLQRCVDPETVKRVSLKCCQGVFLVK